MRRNPRPIPLDIEYFEDLTEEMLLGYYSRLVQYKGLPIYRSTLMRLMKTLPKRFKIKLCRDEDLEFCVDYKTKRFNRTIPILGMAGYPRFEVEGMTDVRGVQLPLTEVSTRVRGQDLRLASTDLPFIAAAATPNQDGLTAYIFVALNGGMSPKDFVDLYEEDYDFLFHLLYQILVHEFTHARDVISLDFLGFMGGLSHEEDRNTKVELRSRLREIIEDVRKHIRNNGFDWLQENLQRKPMDQVIKQISLPYLMDYDVYTDDSHVYLMGGVYQWLIENGYTIPRRRF